MSQVWLPDPTSESERDTRQDKARQGKARQNKTRQDQTREDETRPDQVRQDVVCSPALEKDLGRNACVIETRELTLSVLLDGNAKNAGNPSKNGADKGSTKASKKQKPPAVSKPGKSSKKTGNKESGGKSTAGRSLPNPYCSA
jgi:hypothetical protein